MIQAGPDAVIPAPAGPLMERMEPSTHVSSYEPHHPVHPGTRFPR